MADRLDERYSELYETFQLDETVASTETIKQSTPDAATTLQSLQTFHMSIDGVAGGDLTVGRTLGEGGMGLVRAATQAPFGREVALKTLREGQASNEKVAHALLREAIVTGRLEHPNVVPIYAVGQDAQGLPVIVMKRIEGRSWREYLDDPTAIPSDDALEWNLRVFQQVCSAVHYAHRHGVLHRDIKPDNVMIGTYDDVYVVDWGLAVALEPGNSRLPWVGDVKTVGGTPGYMAPEMASAGSEPLGIWTDVYLLGSVLHEIVTGKLRHDGDTMYAIMLAAYRSDPVPHGPEVPSELAAICNRATSRDPKARHETAADLRASVGDFLDHRTAASLTKEALQQLAALAVALASEAPEEERRVAVYRLYGAARFGFERSLAEWPEQEDARAGLQKTLEHMIDWELGHGSAHAAAALVADLPTPRPELAERVAAVELAQAESRKELEALRDRERQRDISVGARSRAIYSVVIIVLGMLVPAIVELFGIWSPFASTWNFWGLAAGVGFGVPAFLGFIWWRNRGSIRTETNKLLFLSVSVISLFLPAFRGLGIVGGVSTAMQLSMELATFALFTALIAVVFDPRILVSSTAYAAATALALAFPDRVSFIYFAGGAIAFGWIAWIWFRRSAPRAAPSHDA